MFSRVDRPPTARCEKDGGENVVHAGTGAVGLDGMWMPRLVGAFMNLLSAPGAENLLMEVLNGFGDVIREVGELQLGGGQMGYG